MIVPCVHGPFLTHFFLSRIFPNANENPDTGRNGSLHLPRLIARRRRSSFTVKMMALRGGAPSWKWMVQWKMTVA